MDDVFFSFEVPRRVLMVGRMYVGCEMAHLLHPFLGPVQIDRIQKHVAARLLEIVGVERDRERDLLDAVVPADLDIAHVLVEEVVLPLGVVVGPM